MTRDSKVPTEIELEAEASDRGGLEFGIEPLSADADALCSSKSSSHIITDSETNDLIERDFAIEDMPSDVRWKTADNGSQGETLSGVRRPGKRNVIGILVDPIDYKSALDFIFETARLKKGATISALAVHGVMTGVLDAAHRYRLNNFDLIVPDGQPVRWVLNFLYKAALSDRVYGPNLTLKVCERAADEGQSIFLYGGTPEILGQLQNSLKLKFPALKIAGAEASKFRRLEPGEKGLLAERIASSGASIVLVGLGCPRQEVFAYEFRDSLKMPILAVGAAFPFIAGLVPQAPRWMQDRGLEWLFRLMSEPRRLWKRYVYLNPAYLFLVALQALKLSRFPTNGNLPNYEELFG
jgi:exopolysaccharide biosynthesis WecB/TagA/CpsF family protein